MKPGTRSLRRCFLPLPPGEGRGEGALGPTANRRPLSPCRSMPHIDTTAEIQQVFPYLIVRDCPAAIDFYQRVFGAEENMRLAEPSGRIGHAELKLGAAMVMLAEEFPERGVLSPLAYGGSGSMLHLHVANVDEMTKRAAE